MPWPCAAILIKLVVVNQIHNCWANNITSTKVLEIDHTCCTIIWERIAEQIDCMFALQLWSAIKMNDQRTNTDDT